LLKIGYFYILKDIVLGEAVSPNDSTIYEGHAAFWENESLKFFGHSSEIKHIRLCWYGCDRGRITCFEGQYQFFGTSEALCHQDRILSLLGFVGGCTQVITRRDEHYKVNAAAKKLIDRNIKYLNIPKDYPYFIGRLTNGLRTISQAV